MTHYPATLRAIADYCDGLDYIEKTICSDNPNKIGFGDSLPVTSNGECVGRFVNTSETGWAFEPFKTDFDEKLTQRAYQWLGNDPGHIISITINQSIGEPTRVDASFVKPGPTCQRT